MISVFEFITQLDQQDIKLWVDGDQLRINAPEGTLTPTLIAQLKKRKAEILAFLREHQADSTVASIPPVPRTQPLPLSFAQQRLWFLEQLGSGAAYNMPAVFRFQGNLNVAALEKTLNTIVRRHESLRTTIEVQDEQPIQLIHQDVTLNVPVIDLRHLVAERQKTEVERLAKQEAQLKFDLKRDLMVRATLLKLAEKRHVLLLTMHHIASDGWSLGVLVRELTALYEAFLHGQPSPLAPLPIQYADFAVWQRNWLQGERLAEQLSYWKKQLAGAPELLQLPTDRPRPAVATFDGSRLEFRISRELTSPLRQLSLEKGSTLFATLLAAFQVLMSRYTGQQDIVVGSPIANRNREEIEPLIGFFVNALALRSDLSDNPTFLELLEQVRQTTEEAYHYQDLPFERLVDELQPERHVNFHPIMQVAFTLQNAPMGTLELPALHVSLEFEVEAVRTDMEVHLWEEEGGLEGYWLYNTNLFDLSTIERMVAHYQTLLSGLVTNPKERIAHLPLLTLAEKQQLLVEWNDIDRHAGFMEAEYAKGASPWDKCIHQLFSEQVERTPEAVAIIFNDEQLTYRELNRRANQLAHYLIERGVGPETLVGICLERSLELVVGLLGILKAGGAYVPLDPTYPEERLAYLLNDAQLPLLLTEEKWRENVPDQGASLVLMDRAFAQEVPTVAMKDSNPKVDVRPDHLAYVIYTSGSTGVPKGVLVEHKGLSNSIRFDIHTFGMQPGARMPHFTSFTFDAATSHLFMALCAGATVYLMSRDTSLLDRDLIRLLKEEAITNAIFPVSMLSALPYVELPDLKILGVGADVCPPEIIKRWHKGRRIFNIYGPTEGTITTTIAECVADGRKPSIGRPIANVQVYILDPEMQPVPIGVAGELHIGGIGVARGYLNRPHLTAKKFISNPFGKGRLYKSGDLVRYLPDGQIEFLGRIDHQVKIRGFRIELGEIEALLSEYPNVREAIVLAREEEGVDNKRLVAYLVPDQVDEEMQAKHLQQWQTLYGDMYNEQPIKPPPPAPPPIIGEGRIGQKLDFNITGWNNSYTGQPIPAPEMEEWVDQTVAEIRDLQKPGDHILEIGCGTGLLLSRLAPDCEVYWGTDYAREALQHVERLKASFEQLKHVTFSQRMADNFDGIKANAFDMLILNSVVQYFPSIEYLLTVLGGAVRVVKPGGFIYVGDVRNFNLLGCYHASVQLYQATDNLTRGQLEQRVQQKLLNEGELLIDPAFFYALQTHLPEIEHVQIRLKRGHYHNELTRFRYQVILQVGTRPEREVPKQEAIGAPPTWHNWRQEPWSLSSLRERLQEQQPEIIRWRAVPNARVEDDLNTLAWLADSSHEQTVGQWRQLRQVTGHSDGVDPESLWGLGEELGYAVAITCSKHAELGAMDVIFQRHLGQTKAPDFNDRQHLVPKPWHTYANNPLLGKTARMLVPKVRHYLQEKLPDYMIPSAFVLLDVFPLTPNGKIDRRALPGPVGVVREPPVHPRTPTEELLATIWQELLTVEEVGIHDNFFEIGGDSILSIQIVSRAKQAGLQITPKQLFEHQTIANLARAVHEQPLPVGKEVSLTSAEQGLVTGILPLTPIQHWFLEQRWQEPHHFNQSVLLEVPVDVEAELLAEVVAHLLAHHDALRLRVEATDGSWRSVLGAPSEELPFELINLSTLPASEQVTALERRANQLQASLNLSEGPLVRVALFKFATSARLLIVIHHLAVDGVSWRILLEDLESAYLQRLRGQEIQLPAKTTSFKGWATWLNEKGPSVVADEGDYWALMKRPTELPVDDRLGENNHASAAKVSHRISREQTQALLNEVPKVYHTQINDLLLTALMLAFREWTGVNALLLDLEAHGREELFEGVDLSRTVGWFTTIFPVRLEVDTSDLGEAIKSIKEQLRQIPNRGIGYGILRYLSPDKIPAIETQVSFNYLGQFDQAVTGTLIRGFATEPSGLSLSPKGTRTHLLDINAMVVEGQLQVDWTYSQNYHQEETISRFALGFMDALQSLITHCHSPEAGGYTPSDFPEAQITQGELDELLGGQKSGLEAIYPLSPMQQGMLFHTLYAPESGEYVEQMAIRLDGELNVLAFQQAWQEVVARHAVLRTSFYWEKLEKHLQVVHTQVELPWTQQDWRALTEPEKQLEAYLAAERKQGFELEQAPLMRYALMRVAKDNINEGESYFFVWSFHHLLLDGWSGPLVWAEVWAFYEAATNRQTLYLERPRPYKDYITWLQQQDLAEAKSYWQQTLQGFTAPTPLLVEQRDTGKSETYVKYHLHLEGHTTAALQEITQGHHLTLNTLLQGAWALLLSRYSGEEDVLFGSTVSGRSPEVSGVEKMVGLFINSLPVRVKVPQKAQLLPWLQERQKEQLTREHYAYTALVDIQRWSEVPSSSRLFESLFAFQNYPLLEKQQPKGLGVQVFPSVERTNYPLTILAALLPPSMTAHGKKEQGAQLWFGINYQTNRFDEKSIQRMAGHLQTLLEGIATNPHRSLGELPLLTEAERHQLLVEWNDTQVPYPSDQCIHQLFEAQVERTPEGIAVVFKDQQLTYRELNAQANQLAHYLIAQGVAPDVLVGICVERSIEMVVGLLGILKAGGAYVPLDPAYPKERLAFMLSDTNVSVLLTKEKFDPHLPQALRRCYLDADWPLGQNSSNPGHLSTANNLAYIMYTSGSTGRPKGVCVTHKNVVRLVQNSNFAQLSAEDVFLQLAPISFDASTLELWGALLNGAKLVVMPPHQPSLEELGQTVIKHQITTLWLTAGLFHLMVDERLEDLRSLRQLLAGGDVLSLSHVKKVLRELPDCQLINGYGPTENTTFTTCYRVREVGQMAASVPIGRPITNTQVYILDNNLQPVPIGVVGRLYTGGDGVARGYHNRPQLTAEKFIANPFGEGHLYDTGDLARWLPDGNIEFRGRLDAQVKIRGFRIELGEIEAVLNQHKSIREVVVVVVDSGPSGPGKRLVAYLVKEEPVSNLDLRSYLAKKLPDYMLPSAFVTLSAMPLTPNGKIDRRALPAPEALELGTGFVAPRDSIEQQLALMFQELLALHSVGVRENFFDLGGHSLLAVRLMAQIQQQFGIYLPLAILFQNPTIEELAHLLKEQPDKLPWSSLVPIQPHGSKPPFFCVPGGGGNVIYFYELVRMMGSEQPFYGLQAVGLDGYSEPHTTVEAMAAHYIEALQSVQPQGPYFIGGHSFGGKVAFEIAQQLAKAGHEIGRLVIFDISAPTPNLLVQKPKGNDPKYLPRLAQMYKRMMHIDLDIEMLRDLSPEEQWQYLKGQRDEAKYLDLLAEAYGNMMGKTLDVDIEVLRELSVEEQWGYLKQQMEQSNMMPAETEIENLEAFARIFRIHFEMQYMPQQTVPIPITLLWAEEERKEVHLIWGSDPTRGWRHYSEGPVEVIFVSGNHTTMMAQPHVQLLAERLLPCLERWDRRGKNANRKK